MVNKPNPKKKRSQRLNKKLRLNEFQELGFYVTLVYDTSVNNTEEVFDDILTEGIEKNGLFFAGSALRGIVYESPKKDIHKALNAFYTYCQNHPLIVAFEFSTLVDINHGPFEDN